MNRHTLGIAIGLLVVAAAPLRSQGPTPKPVVVPFDLLLTKHIVVQVKINGKGPYRVIFDTGAPVTLLSSKVGKEAGIISKNTGAGFSLFGPVSQITIKSLQVGDVKAESVSAVIMDHPTVQILSQVFGPVEGIIGFPFYARYRMTLDYQAKQLTFVPNGFVPRDILQALMMAVMAREKPVTKYHVPAGLWGFSVEKKSGDEESGVTIKQVWADGAAARAGLQVGDRLLTLDDRWTDTVQDCYIAASHVLPGTEAKVTVRRNGSEQTLTIKPEVGL